jgi:RNase P/RNase MRP subunit p29
MAAYAIQFRRGTTTEHSSFTGLAGEVTVDTTKNTVVVHDGSTQGGHALALEGAALSSTTGSFSSNVTVGGTLAVTSTTTMGGNLTMTGHILPSANVTYDLGSTSKMWRDVYIGPGSLYINGKKVIEDDSGSINVTTDANEDLKFTTSGTGTLKLISGNGISITGEINATSGDIQIGDHIDMNSSLIKELATPVSSTDAANKAYVDSTSASAVTGGSNAGSFTTLTTSGNTTIGGNLTVSGTTTTVNSTQIELGDNIIALNADATGSPTQNAGIDVERGDSLNVQLLWDETNDKWTVGSETFVAATFEGDLTGDVTGAVDGVVGGNTPAAVTGTVITANTNFAGNLTGNVTGTVSSLSNHIIDEDGMGSDSATQVPTQQSVKAYVDAQVATKDNTDEITEGSTNQYFTNARARAAISATGSLAYDSGTGVMSFTMNDETVQDIVGAMITGNTETGIAVTYDDADGTLDFVVASQTDENFTTADHSKLDGIEANATADQSDAEIRAAVEAATDSNVFTDADHSKLDAIEATADVTDATNVAAAGAVMESDSTTAAMSFVIDEDNMASDSATKVPTQQSVKAYTDARETAITTAYQSYADQAEVDAKAYADTEIAALVDSSPAAMDTLNELAAALGDDANFSTTVTNSIATKLALAGGTMSGDIAMGGNDITGGGDATFTNFNGTATYAKYADLAERYAADATYEEGTVMAFGGEAEVTSAQGYGSTKIAGVVSTKPAFAMNDAAGNSETHPFIALQGRVPCKVVGTVSKGDILVASDISGTATVWTESTVDPRMTAYVGIAIEDKTTDGEGYVEVKVGK